MPMTSMSSFTASIAAALIALLMPGAGPPPTKIPRRLCCVFITLTDPPPRDRKSSIEGAILRSDPTTLKEGDVLIDATENLCHNEAPPLAARGPSSHGAVQERPSLPERARPSHPCQYNDWARILKSESFAMSLGD